MEKYISSTGNLHRRHRDITKTKIESGVKHQTINLVKHLFTDVSKTSILRLIKQYFHHIKHLYNCLNLFTNVPKTRTQLYELTLVLHIILRRIQQYINHIKHLYYPVTV